nr:hypothetical protein GCM10017745_46560 [Saccharothrix mutabilis subsp. capreolus]
MDAAIAHATTITERDRAWLDRLLAGLRSEYAVLQDTLPRCVIHGDAWQGNLAVPRDGAPTLVDLDHFGIGPREWDLAPFTVDYTDFSRITAAEYGEFVAAYGGYDMTTQPYYRTLATTMELRWIAFALRKANSDPHAALEARHRLACLRGDIEPPWRWTAF